MCVLTQSQLDSISLISPSQGGTHKWTCFISLCIYTFWSLLDWKQKRSSFLTKSGTDFFTPRPVFTCNAIAYLFYRTTSADIPPFPCLISCRRPAPFSFINNDNIKKVISNIIDNGSSTTPITFPFIGSVFYLWRRLSLVFWRK